MSAGTSIHALPLLIVDTSTLNDVTFTDVTSGIGASEAISILHIWNANPDDILISYDGTTAHDVVPGNGQFNYIFQQAGSPSSFKAALAKGTRIYLKLTNAPGVKNIYIAGYYNK